MSKLKCLMIGNCQNTGIIHYLSQSKQFSSTYQVKQYANWQLIRNNCEVPMMDIQSADLFIYQPLRIVHGCYSTDPSVEGSIGYYVSDKCIKLSYPYIFSSALWPLVQKGQNINTWFGNEAIDKLLSLGMRTDDIINLFHQNRIDWEYKDRFQKSIQILKNKETLTDIKVSNFIEKNITERLLFLIPQHPTSIIFLNVANQILEKLNMEKLSENIIDSINDPGLPDSTYNDLNGMHPLHQSIIQDFELKFGEEYTKNSQEFYTQRILNYLHLNGH